MTYSFPHVFEPARYPPAYLRAGWTEAQVQAVCVDLLRRRWRAEVTEIDVGDRRMRGRLVRLGLSPMALKGLGGSNERGIVDLAVTFPGGRAGWFEVKRPARYVPSRKTGKLILDATAGAPTDEQLAFLARQHRAGAVVGVLWAQTDIDAIVRAA